jgi:hypothetical protein
MLQLWHLCKVDSGTHTDLAGAACSELRWHNNKLVAPSGAAN